LSTFLLVYALLGLAIFSYAVQAFPERARMRPLDWLTSFLMVVPFWPFYIVLGSILAFFRR